MLKNVKRWRSVLVAVIGAAMFAGPAWAQEVPNQRTEKPKGEIHLNGFGFGQGIEGLGYGWNDATLRSLEAELRSLDDSMDRLGTAGWATLELELVTMEASLDDIGLASWELAYGLESDGHPAAQDEDTERAARDAERALRQAEKAERRANRSYAMARRALNKRRWDEAIEAFGSVIEAGGDDADGAHYWTAYAHYRNGNAEEALAALRKLQTEFPQSRWLNDAAALQAEIQQRGAQPFTDEDDAREELKEAALVGLMNSDCESAVPILERFLQGNQPPRLKERALFVLAQKQCPRAGEIMANLARGNANPDLQLDAIKYLGLHSGDASRGLLAEVYSSTQDKDIRLHILRSFMFAGDKEKLLQVAKEEPDAELRGEAASQLGMLKAKVELRGLYRTETSEEVKKKLLQGMHLANDTEGLMEVVRSETDDGLKLRAIRNLGLCDRKAGRPFLLELYGPGQSVEVRKEVLHALFMGSDDEALIQIARKETDPSLKKEAVRWLSMRKSKAATDFMLEILEQ